MIPAHLVIKARTAMRLGLLNVIRVAAYHLQIRLRLGAAGLSKPVLPDGEVFRPPTIAPGEGWPAGSVTYFDWLTVPVAAGAAPDWHLNPLNGQRHPFPLSPWYLLPDFDPMAGDIKCFWELSRLGWAIPLAVAARQGDVASLRKLNGWLASWIEQNPAYCGANWKCGQEASLRVMHLAMAAHILGQVADPSELMLAVVRMHLRRIAPTIHYAIAQDNNHGTSEAAALFVGGNWLARKGDDVEATRWAAQGRHWLENRVGRLLEKDGSFSQYSVNYHRLMLDTMSIVEVWRQALSLAKFSDRFYQRVSASGEWLRAMTDSSAGDAPVLGANDGARLLPVTGIYRDYRPSVQLASALFANSRAYSAGPANALTEALGVSLPSAQLPPPVSRTFDHGGYAVLRAERTVCYVRYPRYRFRPGHADALHVDLWRDGQNLLRDGGTFGYHVNNDDLHYFPGTASHNTVQFDGRDQMPRLSRFLFGAWLEASDIQAVTVDASGAASWSGAYQDWQGAAHRRALQLDGSCLTVIDRVLGFKTKAVLRWRLQPSDWKIAGNTIVSRLGEITIGSEQPVVAISLVTGWESRYYLQKAPLPVIEVVLSAPASITTTLRWPAP